MIASVDKQRRLPVLDAEQIVRDDMEIALALFSGDAASN